MYSIETDRQTGLVTLAFSGVMDQDPEEFFLELTTAIESVRMASGDWDLLVDFGDTSVMSQDRAQNTNRIFQWCIAKGIRRCACVTSGITQKMQMQRVTDRSEKMRYFEARNEAEDWLAKEAA